MRVLILGGTLEASALVQALVADPRYAPVLSLAGRTRNPRLPPVPVRIGGFGGVDGLVRALHEMGAEALIDATHPFAVRISANAALAAALANVPLLAIRRPEWLPGEADRWTMLPDLTAAASALGDAPRRVLLTIGKQELAPFRAAARHRYVVRSVEPPDPALLPPGCTVIAARGPFAEADERRLLVEHGIEVIVTKNSGGTATRAKLDAARALSIPVLMIQRPAAERSEAGRERPARSSLLLWRASSPVCVQTQTGSALERFSPRRGQGCAPAPPFREHSIRPGVHIRSESAPGADATVESVETVDAALCWLAARQPAQRGV